MEENKETREKGKKGFYIALYSAVAIIAFTAVGLSTSDTEPKAHAVPEAAQNDDTAVNQSPVKSYKETATQAAQTTTQPCAQTTEAAAEATTQARPAAKESHLALDNTGDPKYTLFDDTQEMIWPVNGPIVMDYSVETGIFDKTLEQYRTHDSICISAGVGENVFAAADGVVLSIADSDEKGKTVTLNHGNGWCTTYSQIDNIDLAEGQMVKQGDIIGCIAQPTKYGSALGSHLDFTVTLNNYATDPKLVLKTEE